MKQNYPQKFLFFLFAFLPLALSGQTYTPIPITGFNQDGIAESIPASASSTIALDGYFVLYNINFATAAGFAGGLPNSGTIVSGTRTYQLEPYNQNNALRLVNNEVGTFQLTAPKAYTNLSLMGFSTFGAKAFTVEVKFTDGTSHSVPGSFNDWFNTAGNVATALGRVDRANGTTDNNTPLTRPSFQKLDIPLTGGNQYKIVDEVVITSAATGNAISFFALSGEATPLVTCPADVVVSNDAGACGAVVNFDDPITAVDNVNSQIDVLLLGADWVDHVNDVQAKLTATGIFNAVDVFNIYTDTPNLATLQQYDAVLVWSQTGIQNPTLLGDNLAAYIEAGGGVIDMVFEIGAAPAGGAYNTDIYRVLNPAGNTSGTTRILGTIDLPTHPLVNGVTTYDGGTGSYHSTSTSLATGAYVVARYDNNAPLIVAKENVGIQNAKRVSLNFYPGSADCPGYAGHLWLPSTDGARMMSNALLWVGGVQLDQTTGLASGATFPIGVTTNTYEITDMHGTTETCSFTVTVNDTELPVAVAQDIAVQLDDTGTVTILPAQVDNGSSDNCTFTLSLDNDTFDCSNIGDNIVTLTVTDATGNIATATAIVTVQDVTSPILEYTTDIAVPANSTNSWTPWIYTFADSLPAGAVVSGVTFTFTAADQGWGGTGASASIFLAGTHVGNAQLWATTQSYVVTYVGEVPAYNYGGNNEIQWSFVGWPGWESFFNGGTFTIHYLMNGAVSNLTLYLDANGEATVTPAQFDNGSATDNCAIQSLALSQELFTCAEVGDNIETLSGTDFSGNTGTRNVRVTVVDNIAPAIVTQDITVQLDATGVVTITPAQVDNGSSDNCAIASMVLDVTTFDCTNTGANTVTLTVTDVNGNIATGTATVTVEDDIVPTVLTQDITVQLDAAGTVTITPVQVDNGSTDNCTIDTITLDVATFDCSNVGPNTVTLTVTDVNGNISTGTATITVEDILVPSVVTQDIIVQLDAAGTATITPAQIDNGSADNCAIDTMTLDVTAFDCTNVGTNTVTLTVTDVNGNVATGTATVTVEDTVSPTITTQDITVELSDQTGTATITAAQVTTASSDNCGVQSITVAPDTFDVSSVGANTVTVTITDVNGNLTVATAVVTVNLPAPPTVTCPADIAVNNDAGLCSAVVNYTVPASSITNMVTMDFEGAINFAVTYGEEGMLITATDHIDAPWPLPGGVTGARIHMGNTTWVYNGGQTFTPVSVEIIANPGSQQFVSSTGAIITPVTTGTFTFPATPDWTNITSLQWNNIGFGDIDIDNFIFNAAGQPALSAGLSSGAAFPVGTTTNTYTVTDIFGQTGTCSFDVTVTDNELPVVLTQDITVQLNATGSVTITPAQIDNGSSDNCTIDTITLDVTTFDCTNIGVNTVTLTVTDLHGNANTNTALVTVEDTVAPIVITQDITVQLDAAGTATIAPAQIDNGSSDNCTIDTITLDVTAFDCTNVGTNTVVLTVTDVNGNTSTGTAIVTIEDNVLPVAISQNITVQLNAAGQAIITPAQIDNGSSDNCAFTLSLDVIGFNCSDLGDNNVMLTITDASGNTATAPAVVTVEDTQYPAIFAGLIPPAPVTIDGLGRSSSYTNVNLNGTNSNVAFVAPGAPVSFSYDYTSAYTDGAGCPGCVTQHSVGLNGNFYDCHAAGSGGGSVNRTFTAPAAPGVYYITQTATWWFSCGQFGAPGFNDADASVAVAVLVVSDINAVCHETVTQNTDAGQCNAIVYNIDVTALDNCATTLTYTILGATTATGTGSASGTVFNVGVSTVTYTATDIAGNVTSCSFDVIITDTEAPVVNTQDITVQLDTNGVATITPAQIDNGSTDACGVASLILDITDFDCTHVGANTVVLTATDIHGNSATNTAIVTVEDTVAPVVVTQDITVQLDATGNATITPAQVDNGSADACGIASLTLDITNFDCTNVGSNTVTLTVTDVNGNIATNTAVVTVEDTVAPVVVTQDITVQLDATGNVTITPAQIDNGSTDACGIASLTLDITDFDCINVGPNTVTLTVTDVNGNISMGTAVVTVEDTVAPVVVTQDITVQLDAVGQVTITPAQIDNGSTDACGIASITLDIIDFNCNNIGLNTVILTVTDVNGNAATATAVVTVEDNIAPTVLTQNITVQLDAAGTATITPAQINNGSFDNCAIDTIVLDITGFDCTNVGNNTVTLTVTDVNGNTAASTAIVTVEDNIAPIAITQDITVELDAVTGTVTITPAQIDNGSFDNCTFTLSLDIIDFNCSNVGPNNVVLTVTDANGNTATAGAVVTVEDNTLPTVITQNFNIPLNSNGVIMLIPEQVNGGSYDNCGILAMSVAPNMFNCNDFGNHIVTLTVEDVNGNIAQNTAIVTVYDMYNPVAIANDITVQLDAAGTATITPAQIDGGSNDICGIASLTLSQTTFDCNDLGQNTVTLTVTDTYGNVSTDTAIVTVQDTTPPAMAGQPATIFLDANGQATLTVADVDAGTADNCGLQSLIITRSNFNCSHLGNNIITLVGTDINGNVASTNVTVTVIDNIAPVAVAQDVTVSLGTNGLVTITPEMINNNSTDNCGIHTMSLDITSLNCSNIGDTTVTLTVSDQAGNQHSTTATVTVLPVPVPQTPSINQQFCSIDEPTLSDIEMSTGFVVWYADDVTTTRLQPFTPLESGVTYYAATMYGNCASDRIAVTVIVNNPPAPTGEPIQFFCIEEEYTLADLKTNQQEVLWYSSPVGGTPLSAYTVLENNQIYYASYVSGNCESILRLPVRVMVRYCDVTINNAVSANGDGKNDYFFIEGAESFAGNKLEIFNRWGATVYEASNYGNQENLFKGYANSGLKAGGSGLLPIGTYYYVFTFVNHDGQAVTKTGFIHLTY